MTETNAAGARWRGLWNTSGTSLSAASMRSIERCALVVLLAACGGADSSSALRDGSVGAGIAGDASSSDVNAETETESAPRPLRPADLALKPPANVACAIASHAWSGDLQLRANGPVFASIVQAKSTVAVPRERAPAFVTVDASIELHGLLSVPRLYLAKPMALGGFIIPLATTPIPAPGPHAEGRLSVTFPIAELFSDPPAIAQELPCEAISTMPSSYDVRKILGVPNGEPPEIELDAGDLRLSPDVAPIARISFASKVWLTGGWGSGARRVVLEGSRYFAIGWVAREQVQPRRRGVGFGSSGRLGRPTIGYSKLLTCQRDLPVFVQLLGERARVGALRAGQGFVHASDPPKDLAASEVAISVPGSWLVLAEGAAMFVQADDLAGCHE